MVTVGLYITNSQYLIVDDSILAVGAWLVSLTPIFLHFSGSSCP